MQIYMMANAHREAMPKLVEWSDKASVVHWNLWVARSIYLAAQLGIADVFDEQLKTIAQIAAETETQLRSLLNTPASK
nr:hypothetical protein [Nostoc sp. DedSLP05]MDZ8100863.1 hypothetical protein [Nostoc sp. DedSLP01]